MDERTEMRIYLEVQKRLVESALDSYLEENGISLPAGQYREAVDRLCGVYLAIDCEYIESALEDIRLLGGDRW